MPMDYDVTKDLRFIQGVDEKNLTFTTSLIQNTDFDDAKIAMLVGVTVEYVKNLRNA